MNHLDKLLTYEIILGPSLPYNKNFYEEFRQLSVIENAIRYIFLYLLLFILYENSSKLSYVFIPLNTDLQKTVTVERWKLCLLIMVTYCYRIG